MSRHAAWMQRTISAVESNSVPSQSKTIRSKSRGMSGLDSQSGEEVLAILRQRRLQLETAAVGRMVERQPARMQEHAPEAQRRARHHAVQREVSVLVVADDRMPFVR